MSDVEIRKNALSLELRRPIAAPRSIVWRCWSEPELLKQWYCPKPWHVSDAEIDLKAGGRMNVTMAGPDGEKMDVKGCLLEVVPGEALTFTDAYTEGFIPQPESFMTGFVRLHDADDGGTHMTWGARHATEDAVQQHLAMGFETGWTAASQQLEDLAQNLQGEQS